MSHLFISRQALPIALLAALLSGAAGLRAHAEAQAPDHGEQDFAVFAALLNHPSIPRIKKKPGLVLISDTTPSETWPKLEGPQSAAHLKRVLRRPQARR